MNFWWYLFIFYEITVSIVLVKSAIVPDSDDIEKQGLYSKSDNVEILTNQNFDRKIHGQNHALLVQFYNSYCGHCRSFAPKFKTLASELVHWKNVIKLATIDCSVEENSGICRSFEVMAYPSLRYLHELYPKGNAYIGEVIQIGDISDVKAQLIAKMQTEQSMGRLKIAPSFKIASYDSFASALRDTQRDVLYTFLVFENNNSTVGSEIALDVSGYEHVNVKRVYDTSELTNVAGIRHFPGLVAVEPDLQPTQLTPKEPSKQNLLKSINAFLKSKNYVFPASDISQQVIMINENSNDKHALNSGTVYYTDLEKTLSISLFVEITRYKTLNAERQQALLDYLDVIITSFPFRANLKDFIMDLRASLAARNNWSGSEVSDLVKQLEYAHAPVFTNNLDYIACKGSEPKFRGYTCGVWTLFHTLTVNAAQKPGNEGPKVLKAMHGYVKNFFGCTECAEHFQAMATRNRIFDVKENDKAVLWLWISHNEVNLRLAGDVTEDPEYPKIQYPSVTQCPECRLARGAWNLPAVYQYLQTVYGADNIRDARRSRSAVVAPSPFSNLDIGMLSLLYILSFVILILVIRFFLTKRFYRKRHYKHGMGKV